MTGVKEELGLTPAQLRLAFPFHFALDRELAVFQTGDGLRKIFPGFFGAGALARHFRISRPALPNDFAALRAHGPNLVILESLDDRVHLRGQFLSAAGETLLFLGTPWVTAPSDLTRCGLSLSDFAHHDSISDLLQLFQAQQVALADSRKLTARLTEQQTELRQLAESLQRQVAAGGAGTLNEVMERRLADERFRLLFEHSPNPHLLCDDSGIVDCNEATLRLFGAAGRAELVSARGAEPRLPVRADSPRQGHRRATKNGPRGSGPHSIRDQLHRRSAGGRWLGSDDRHHS